MKMRGIKRKKINKKCAQRLNTCSGANGILDKWSKLKFVHFNHFLKN